MGAPVNAHSAAKHPEHCQASAKSLPFLAVIGSNWRGCTLPMAIGVLQAFDFKTIFLMRHWARFL
jgi:hypothetical protein